MLTERRAPRDPVPAVLPSRPVTAPAPASQAPEPAAALVAEGLRCLRGERELLAGLTLELQPGTMLQVEGPNGSGKTTLLRALCGLVPLEAGRVTWHGTDIAAALDDYHGALTYIGHVPGVKQDLTPRENLASARALAAPAADGLDAAGALARLGLSGPGDTPLRRLSAGQCRRTALARLLVAPTPLWLLDEPFTALDRAGRELVTHLLADHCANGGMAVVATHQPLDDAGIALRHLRLGA